MAEAALSTRIGTEIGNALGELNRTRPRLAAYVDANRAGPTRAAYAFASQKLLNGLDLFVQTYRVPEPEVKRIRISSVRRSYGITFALEQRPARRRLTAVGAEAPLDVASLGSDGARVSLGGEMGGDPTAWMLRRPKRNQELLVNDNVIEAVEELFHSIDRHCDLNVIDPRFLTVDGIFERGLRYVDLRFTNDTPDRYRRSR